MALKYIFSGHESFQCRQLWLKKGYDFVLNNKNFNDEDAVVHLGVGKNMVSSIRFWMKAFNILTLDDKLTDFGRNLLDDNGYDPFLEDEASLWLLHYQLVKTGLASSYSILFNEFRREKIEFTKENYTGFIKRKSESQKSFSFNEKTILEDFSVLCKMYVSTSKDAKEDSFSGLLTDLGILKSLPRNKEDLYSIENSERKELPDEVILFALLDNENHGDSISFNNIENDFNGIGSLFAINRIGLLNKIESLTKKYPFIVFNDQAGIKEIQFKKKPSAYKILEKYYAN